MASIRPSDYVVVSTAALLAGTCRDQIHRLLARGEIRGVWIDGQWFVARSSAESWQRTGTRGPAQLPPRKGKPRAKPPGMPNRQQPATINPGEWVGVGTAASLVGCSPAHVRRLIRRSMLPAVWIDRQWIVLRSAAEGHQLHPTRGRPRLSPVPEPRSRPKPTYGQPSQPVANPGVSGGGRSPKGSSRGTAGSSRRRP